MAIYCHQDGCRGHMGKFENCLAEAIWQWWMNGWAADETGDTDLWGAYYALFIVAKSEWVCIPDGPTVTVPVGAYILVTLESGAVELWRYDTESDAREEFDAQDREYGIWLQLDN